ncbi:hypothetical protein MRX96_009729 [Rhipicephalus microplus]
MAPKVVPFGQWYHAGEGTARPWAAPEMPVWSFDMEKLTEPYIITRFTLGICNVAADGPGVAWQPCVLGAFRDLVSGKRAAEGGSRKTAPLYPLPRQAGKGNTRKENH